MNDQPIGGDTKGPWPWGRDDDGKAHSSRDDSHNPPVADASAGIQISRQCRAANDRANWSFTSMLGRWTKNSAEPTPVWRAVLFSREDGGVSQSTFRAGLGNGARVPIIRIISATAEHRRERCTATSPARARGRQRRRYSSRHLHADGFAPRRCQLFAVGRHVNAHAKRITCAFHHANPVNQR